MKLGMLTTSNLPPELKSIKSAFNITLVQFQRAPVTIQPYNKQHLFETASFITDDLQKVVGPFCQKAIFVKYFLAFTRSVAPTSCEDSWIR